MLKLVPFATLRLNRNNLSIALESQIQNFAREYSSETKKPRLGQHFSETIKAIEEIIFSKYFRKRTKKLKTDEVESSIGEAKKYFDSRCATVQRLKENAETHPYPHKYEVSMTLKSFVADFKDLNDGEKKDDVNVSVAGRVHSIRDASSKLYFYDLRGDGTKIQVMATAGSYSNAEEFKDDVTKIKRGDIIGVQGFPTKTKRGELSIVPSKAIEIIFKNTSVDFDCSICFTDDVTCTMSS